LVAALLRVAGVTAGLAESNGSLPPGLWLTSPAGWLPRTGISSGTLRSAIEYGLPLPFYPSTLNINACCECPLKSPLHVCRTACSLIMGTTHLVLGTPVVTSAALLPYGKLFAGWPLFRHCVVRAAESPTFSCLFSSLHSCLPVLQLLVVSLSVILVHY